MSATPESTSLVPREGVGELSGDEKSKRIAETFIANVNTNTTNESPNVSKPSPMLKSFLNARYVGDFPRVVAVREHVAQVCADFVGSGLADPDFESELCSGNDPRFWQRFTEAFLGSELRRIGLRLLPARSGPDHSFESHGITVRIECICPEPKGVPEEWLSEEPQVAGVTFPHPEILLRWTAAIKEKVEKFLGGAGNAGYIAKGVIGNDDVCVVAVNGRQLRGLFASIDGISGFPFALEAVFPQSALHHPAPQWHARVR